MELVPEVVICQSNLKPSYKNCLFFIIFQLVCDPQLLSFTKLRVNFDSFIALFEQYFTIPLKHHAFLVVLSTVMEQVVYKTSFKYEFFNFHGSFMFPSSEPLFFVQSDTPDSVDERTTKSVLVIVIINLIFFGNSCHFIYNLMPFVEAVCQQSRTFIPPELFLLLFEKTILMKNIFYEPLQANSD